MSLPILSRRGESSKHPRYNPTIARLSRSRLLHMNSAGVAAIARSISMIIHLALHVLPLQNT